MFVPDQEDVPSDSSPETQPEDVTTEQEQTQADSSAATTEHAPSAEPPQAVKDEASREVDDKGVPWKNREAEIRRKLIEEIVPVIRQTVQETISATKPQETQQAQTQPQQYSLEQLEWIEENHPEYKVWARSEKSRIIKDEAKREALAEMRKETRTQGLEQDKQTALRNVFQRYPTAFVSGQWNHSDPLVQRALQLYSSRKSFQEDGFGLEGAFDMAFGQMAYEQKAQMSTQKARLSMQQKKEEKKALQTVAAGSGSPPSKGADVSKAKQAKLMEAWKAGDREAGKELMKMRGLIPADMH